MYLLYSVLLGLALLLLSPYLLVRGLRQSKYLHSLRERLGRVPEKVREIAAKGEGGTVWVHAVSVGEALAVAPLLKELRARLPGHPIFVSTTTRTGQELAAKRLEADAVFYFPLDFGFACRRALAAARPALIVIAETEICQTSCAKRGARARAWPSSMAASPTAPSAATGACASR
jgi:3-deoxy-D-manno-octulosonic-acid transferase